MKKLIIVGAAGKQGHEYFTMLKDKYEIVALVDINLETLNLKYAGQGIPAFQNVKDAVEQVKADVAVLAVPHAFHFELTTYLLQQNLHVIKEKPFALNEREAEKILTLARHVRRSVFVITQRHSTNSFEILQKNLDIVGRPLYFNYEFFMKLPSQTSGWRARKDISIGGVVLDMGYHAVDVLRRLFGEPSKIQSNASYRYDEMLKEGLEDSSMSVFSYSSGLYGNLLLDRHSDKKHERLKIVGSSGSIEWQMHSLVVESKGEIVFEHKEEKNSAYVLKQLEHYIDSVENRFYFEQQSAIYMSNSRTIERMYNNADAIFLPNESSKLKSNLSRLFLDLNPYVQKTNLYAIRS